MKVRNNIRNCKWRSNRGRPRLPKQAIDRGTPELQRKHACGETRDPLDVCLERGLISEGQHWSGVHLSWLYCLRFGVPQPQAVDVTELRGRSLQREDTPWRAAREKEYRRAMEVLAQSSARQAVKDLCVHRIRPRFLDINRQRPTAQRLHGYAEDVERIQEALAMLARHWGRE